MSEEATKEINIDEDRLLSPAEAVEFLNKYLKAEITVDILRQMRRKGRVKGTQLGGKNSRTTVYRVGDLLQADIDRRKPGRPNPIEKNIEMALGKLLEEQGIPVRHQVPYGNEMADLVTPNAIYEIKSTLSKNNFRRAVNQAVSFRNHIHPSVKIVIVGYQDDKDPVDFEYALSQEVEVMLWEDQPRETEQ